MNPTERIKALSEARARAVNDEKALLASIKPGDARTAEQVEKLERINAQIREYEATIAQINAREAREAENAALREQAVRVYGEYNTTPGRGSTFGVDLHNAIAEVIDGRATSYVEAPRNVLTTAGPAGDGVPTQIATPVTTLAASSVVMSLPGIGRFTMTSDRAVFPRIGDADVDGTAEATTLNDANTEVDAITVVATKFSTYEELSSELVEDYSADALAVFGANLLKRLALRVDRGLLEGDGALDLVGIRNVPGVNSTSVAAKPVEFIKARTAEYELLTDNGNPVTWVMHPRTWNIYAGIKTGISGDETTLLEPNPQRAPRELLGYPVALSTQITLTEGAGAGSWAALIDTSQLLVCERRPARLEVSRDHKFDQDLISVRATWRGALAVLNPEAISLLTDIRSS